MEDKDFLLGKIKLLEQENEHLRSENKKLLSAVEYSPATIVVTDLNGNIEYANPGFTEITGYAKEEAFGSNPRLLKSGYHDKDFYKDLWETIRSGNVWQGEFYNKKKNGEFYWEQAHIAPIKDDAGNITHFVAIKFDITKKIESENYLKTITNAIPELIFVMDEDGRYIDVMVADDETLSFNKDRYIGKLVDEAFPAPLATKLKGFIADTIQTGNKQIIEYYVENPSDRVWYEAKSALFPIKLGGKRCVIIAAHDITYRKKAEHDLKELNATKDKFFTILAHDLKNPFGAIINFSKLLMESVGEQDTNESVKYAGFIHTSAEATFDLLENLLQWARSQTGRIEFKPQKFVLSQLVDSVIKTIESQAINKGIKVEKVIVNDLVLLADMNSLKTVIRNLISNAIKYTNAGGKIVLETNNIPGFVQISVIDNGVGIPPEGIEKLFRIDSKYTTPGTKMEKGTGLGLILCKEFVELLGGKIWVESKVGVGSKFSFTLPRNS